MNVYIIPIIGCIVLALEAITSLCRGKTKRGLVLAVIAMLVLTFVCKKFNIMI